MLPRQDRILGIIIPNRIHIILTNPARQIHRRKLPETIIRHLRTIHHRHLPGQLRARMIMRERRPILLQHHRLPRRLTHTIVLLNPGAPPRIIVAPGVRIQMEGGIVEGRNLQIGREIDADVTSVGVSPIADAIGRREPALVAERHHVLAVERLDVGARVRRPAGDDGGVAALAARLVAELPREDGGRVLVALD